jgi:hypothetical protein
MTDWYIARDGVQRGPFLERDLQKLADRGDLKQTDFVWKEGLPDWRPATSLSHIKWVYAPPPPPPYQQQTRVQLPPNQSAKALVAMICSIVGFITLPIILHIVGMALGYSARREIDESRGAISGRAYATTAIVLGWIALAGLGLILILVMLFFLVG